MPSATRTTRSEYLNSTLEAWRSKKATSIIDRPVPFIEDLMSMGMGEPKQGGDGMRIPLRVRRHSNTVKLATGYEPMDLSVQPTLDGGKIDWLDLARAVVISGHEERINGGPEAMVKIALDREEDTLYHLKMEWQQAILTGNVAAWSDCETLNGIDYTDGWLEHRSYGSQTNTVEAVSKSTYAGQVGWNQQFYDMQNSFSTYGLVGAFAVQSRIESLSMFGDSNGVWYGTRLFGENYKRDLQPQERYATEKDLDGLKRALLLGGKKLKIIYQDLPSAGTNSATYKASAIHVDWNHVKWSVCAGANMKASPYKECAPLYDVSAKLISHMGQLHTDYLATLALIVRGETY